MKERRSSERFMDEKYVKITRIFPVEADVRKNQMQVFTRDVSAGGMRLISEESLSVDALIQMELNTGASELMMVGQVRWSREIAELQAFETGVEFVNVSDTPAMQSYLLSLKKKSIDDQKPITKKSSICVKFLSCPDVPILEDQMFYCRVGDLFKDGMQMVIPLNIDMDAAIEVRIDFVKPPLKFKQKGRIAWTRHTHSGYMAGIEFLDMSDITKTLWCKTLISLQNTKKQGEPAVSK